MRWLVALMALSVLAGCSGGGDPEPTPTAAVTSEKPAATTSTSSAAVPSGQSAPEALSSFRCEPAKKGAWVAAGFLANGGKKPATYQVSVYVGPLDSESRRIRTMQVASVAAGASVRFEITKVPGDGDECHVQVIKTDVG